VPEESDGSHLNGSTTDKNTLLFDLDPEAPSSPGNSTNTNITSSNDPFKQFANLSSQQDNKTEALLDFEGSTVHLTPQSNEQEQQLSHQVYEKVDLVTSPSTPGRQPPPSFDTEQPHGASTQSKIEEKQSGTSPKLDSTLPTASSVKKPAASTARPTSAAKPKPSPTTAAASKSTEQKPTAAAAAATTSKSTEHKPTTSTAKTAEPKPATTVRKTLHSAPTTAAAPSKPKVTSTSSTQESSTDPKPTVNITINLNISQAKFIFLL
jgi:septum formation inhibitor MinC